MKRCLPGHWIGRANVPTETREDLVRESEAVSCGDVKCRTTFPIGKRRIGAGVQEHVESVQRIEIATKMDMQRRIEMRVSRVRRRTALNQRSDEIGRVGTGVA